MIDIEINESESTHDKQIDEQKKMKTKKYTAKTYVSFYLFLFTYLECPIQA